MKKVWQTGTSLMIGFVAFVAVVATPNAREQQATDPNVMVDPAILSTMQFRHLSVFSRGGRSTAVTGVPSNPTLFYLGTTGGGVWQTTNSGESWTNISDGFFEAGSIGAIDVSLSDPNVIYVGTGSACPRGNISPGVGMYKSTDAGKTWKHIGLRAAGSIGRVRVHPTNPNLVYVAVLGNLFAPSKERGVYRSKDGGTTWENVKFISDRTGAVDLTMDPKNPDTMIAAMWTTERKPWTIESGSTEGGMFKTTDGGNTWTKLGGGLPDKVMVGRIGVSISPADPRRVYAQVEAGDDLGGVYISNDGGTTWTPGFKGRAQQQRAWYYTHIVADPVEVDTVYGLNVGPSKSTDGGKTFVGANIQSHSDYHDMWINPKNNKIQIVGNDGGGAITTGVETTRPIPGGGTFTGVTWSQQENQPTSEIYRLTVDNRYPYWVYGAQQDNDTVAVPSQGNAATYGVGGGESGYIAVDPRDHGIIYAGNYGGAISRMNQRMGVFESVRVYADSQTGQRAADMKYRFQWNAPILISPHDPDTVYTTSQVVHRTRDGGMNWDVVSPDMTRNDKRRQQYSGGEGITRDNTGVEVYATIFAFEESPTTPGLLWSGSDDGLVYVSRDNAKSWKNVTPKDWPEGTINAIAPSYHTPGRAFVAMHRYRMGDLAPYLYMTDDYGATWKRIADGKNGIPDWHFTRAIFEDPKRKGLLYAGTEFGLYVSFNDGANWQKFQQNLPITPVTDLMVYRNDLIVTTQGRGFWIMDNMAAVQSVTTGSSAPAAILFKPEEAYRAGGRPPTFQYWFREKPTAPVEFAVLDAKGTVLFNTSAQPADRPTPPAGGAGPAGGGRGGGGRGRGGFGGPGAATAYQGMNTATWGGRVTDVAFTVPPRIVGWGIGAGPSQGPKYAPGNYQVKVTSGTWTATQPFTLLPDPRLPKATAAQYAEQFKVTTDIGAMTKRLYAELARIRDAKTQLAEPLKSSGAGAAAAKVLNDKLVGVESVLTQIQGEGGQDGLNFPGRLDNQWVVLYQNASGAERWPVKGVIERYNDLLPETNKLFADIQTVLTKDVATYNAEASKAGLKPVTIK